MKLQIFLFVCVLSCANSVFAQSFAYQEKSGFAERSNSGEVSVESQDRAFRRGEMVHLKYTFHSINSSYNVYNWQFNGLIPLPGQLAIYDAEKQYIGDLMAITSGSRKTITDDDWTFLYGETWLSKPLGFRAGFVPGTKYDHIENPIPLGTYYIQLILYRAFVSPNPFRTVGEKWDFYETFDRSALCRSNALKIEIVDR
jgi:hypothetical protein